MDRNREGRRSIMAASSNGLSRRRHRSNSLRDSPDDDGPTELQEPTRLRDRGLKKDRDRDRSSRSKRRKGDRPMRGSNRDDSSEESVSGEDENDDEDGGCAGGSSAVRMLPVHQPMFPSASHHHHNQVRENNFYEAPKPANELIGFSVPRKARSASTKRSHESWVSGSGVGGEHSHRQSSATPSPVRPDLASPAPASPSSSTVSVRKKMKLNGTKQRPPKSGARLPPSKPEEIEFEIAEVLYGMTQSQGPSKKDFGSSSNPSKLDSREMNKSKSDSKSGVLSPISDSTSTAPENRAPSSFPLSTSAPKRKRPRQVTEDMSSSSVRQSPISSSTEAKTKIEPEPEKKLASAGENDDLANPQAAQPLPEPTRLLETACSSSNLKPPAEEPREIPDLAPAKPDLGQAKVETSAKKESPVAVVTQKQDTEEATATIAKSIFPETERRREEKFEIDLMAPPPQSRSSPEREDFNFVGTMEKKPEKSSAGDDEVKADLDQKTEKVTTEKEQDKPTTSKEREPHLQLDLEKKHERDVGPSGEKSNSHFQVKIGREEQSLPSNTVQCSSLPLPVSLASWPNGFPPIGYMAPLPGVASIGGNPVVPPSPVQPLFSQPRPKRCATHCYIARSIHCQQQMMKMNPFWPGAAAPIFGAKTCNLNVVQPGELQRNLNTISDRHQGLSVLSGHAGREKDSQAANVADSQRKQQILLQQAMPPGAPPSNVMHGPAFIFPLNQQAVVAAAASVRSGSAKPPATAASVATTNASSSIPTSGSATVPPAVSFNYPNMPPNETHQYLAILQNNPYPFPIPATAAQPAFGGSAHAQPIPYFNGSFYPSQMMHPLQIQQQQQQQQSAQQQQQQQQHQQQSAQQQQQGNHNASISSVSSTSQKQHPKQQHQQQRSHLMPASHQAGGEDSPSTADSRVSRPPIFAQNFAANFSSAMPAHSNGVNHGAEKKPQPPAQQGMKQTFTMSFAAMNGVDISSMPTQNHAVLQSLPEATRNGSHHQIMVAAASAQAAAQQKKNARITEEEGKSEGNSSSNNVDEEKKSLVSKAPPGAAQSIAFSRNAMPNIGTANPSNSQLQAQLQYQHQQMMQFQKHQQQQQQQLLQQQQHLAARNKSLATSNGSAYSDHLASSTSGTAKFPSVHSAIPQNLGRSSSPTQSPQWKSSARNITSQVQSSLASTTMKTQPQPQARARQNHTQISFGASQKPSATSQGHQVPGNHPSQAPQMMVGSPTSSLSKGGGGSPKTTSSSGGNKAAQPSPFASQHSRNSSPVGGRSTPSILGNPHIFPSNSASRPQMQQQPQLQKQPVQQAQLLFSNAYMQAQASQQPTGSSSAASATSAYYMQRWRPEQQQQSSQPQGSNTSTSDAKAVVSSAATNVKGGGGLASQGTGVPQQQFAPPGFSYHTLPAAVQVKQKEQKPAA